MAAAEVVMEVRGDAGPLTSYLGLLAAWIEAHPQKRRLRLPKDVARLETLPDEGRHIMVRMYPPDALLRWGADLMAGR